MTWRVSMANKNNAKYKPEYCEALVKHMENGDSFESFAAVVRVTQDTLQNWANKHEEFKLAKDHGKAFELLYWENLLKTGASGNLPPIRKRVTVFDENKNVKQVTVTDEPGKFNVTSVIFALKNKFPRLYRDRSEVEITSKESIDQLSDEEIKRRKELYNSILLKKKNNG
jgi:hypothetical protein